MVNANTQLDNELLKLLEVGDRMAYTILYERYWKDLFNSAYKRLKDKEQCQDIVQIVLTDLWQRRENIVIEDLPAYLHTAVRFQVLKHISRKPSHCEFLDELEVILTSPVKADDELLEKELLKLAKLWIDALPEKRRAIFLMHAEEELSTREIAAKLSISQKTVQNQVNTAATTLKIRLSEVLSIYILFL